MLSLLLIDTITNNTDESSRLWINPVATNQPVREFVIHYTYDSRLQGSYRINIPPLSCHITHAYIHTACCYRVCSAMCFRWMIETGYWGSTAGSAIRSSLYLNMLQHAVTGC